MTGNSEEDVLQDPQDLQVAPAREIGRRSPGFSSIVRKDYLLLALAAFPARVDHQLSIASKAVLQLSIAGESRMGLPVQVTVNQIRLTPFAVARALGVVAFLLVLASIAGQLTKYLFGHDRVYHLVPLFNVDAERSVPTIFSVLLLFCSALLLAVIALFKNRDKDPDVSKWVTLAFGFLLMTVDEACVIHERLMRPVRGLLGDDIPAIFHFAWVIPGLAFVFILGLVFVKFLVRLPAKPRLTFMFAATLFLGGAIGMELVGGRYAELYGGDNLTYNMIATVEESLEMAGVIVFIYGLLTYIGDHYEEVRLRLDTME